MTKQQWSILAGLAAGVFCVFSFLCISLAGTIIIQNPSQYQSIPIGIQAALLIPTMTPTPTASETPVAIMTPRALTTPRPTPGAVSTSSCGNYRVVQEFGLVPFRAPGVTEVTLVNEQNQTVKTFGTNQVDEPLTFTLGCAELIGNDVSQLVIETRTQGNDCCSSYDILSMTKGLPSLLLHWDAGKGGIARFALLRAKPPYEIVGFANHITLDRVALQASLPFVFSPTVPVVFALRGDKYVQATAEYPQILRDDQAVAIQRLGQCGGDEFCEKGLVLQIYADGVWLNEEAQTLDKVKAQVQPRVVTWLNSIRTEALAALSNDSSSPLSTSTPSVYVNRAPTISPSPTPKPTLTPDSSASVYVSSVQAILDDYANTFDRLTTLFLAASANTSLLRSDAWASNTGFYLAKIRANNRLVRGLKAPQKYLSAQADLVEAAAHYDRYVTLFASGIDSRDDRLLGQAQTEFRLGNALTQRAIGKLALQQGGSK